MEIEIPVLKAGPPEEVLWQLRSMWELAATVHFLSIFKPFLHMAQGFSVKVEDIEAALCDPESLLMAELHVKLLRALLHRDDITYSHEIESKVHSKFITTVLWQDILVEVLKERGEGYNPLAETLYVEISLQDRMKTFHLLCELLMTDETLLNFVEEKELEADAMRGRSIGTDSHGSIYWYFNDQRLYREVPVVEAGKGRKATPTPKKRSRRGPSRSSARRRGKKAPEEDEPSDDEAAAPDGVETPQALDFTVARPETAQCPHLVVKKKYQWETVCVTSRDWESIVAWLANPKGANEADLASELKEIGEEVLPPLQAREREIEKQKLLDAIPRKRSHRIQRKEIQSQEDEKMQFLRKEEERLRKVQEEKARKEKEEREAAERAARERAAELAAQKEKAMRMKEEQERERQRRQLEREQRLAERELQLQLEREADERRRLQREERLRHRKDGTRSRATSDVDTAEEAKPAPIPQPEPEPEPEAPPPKKRKRKAKEKKAKEPASGSETEDQSDDNKGAGQAKRPKRPRKRPRFLVDEPGKPRRYYVFSTTVANAATVAVREGRFANIVDYHLDMQQRAHAVAAAAPTADSRKGKPQPRGTTTGQKLPRKLKKQEVWAPPPGHKDHEGEAPAENEQKGAQQQAGEGAPAQGPAKQTKPRRPRPAEGAKQTAKAAQKAAAAAAAAAAAPVDTTLSAQRQPSEGKPQPAHSTQPQAPAHAPAPAPAQTPAPTSTPAAAAAAGGEQRARQPSLPHVGMQAQGTATGQHHAGHYGQLGQHMSPPMQSAGLGQQAGHKLPPGYTQPGPWELGTMLPGGPGSRPGAMEGHYAHMPGHDLGRQGLPFGLADTQQAYYPLGAPSHRLSSGGQQGGYGLGMGYGAPQYQLHQQHYGGWPGPGVGGGHPLAASPPPPAGGWTRMDPGNSYMGHQHMPSTHPLAYGNPRDPAGWGAQMPPPMRDPSRGQGAGSWGMGMGDTGLGGMDTKDLQLVAQLSQMRRMP